MTTPITPAEFAAARGFSERAVRRKAREIGACRILGKTMILEAEDVAALLEALKPCPLSSTGAVRSGTTGARLPGGSYAELQALRTRRSPGASQAVSKPARNTGV